MFTTADIMCTKGFLHINKWKILMKKRFQNIFETWQAEFFYSYCYINIFLKDRNQLILMCFSFKVIAVFFFKSYQYDCRCCRRYSEGLRDLLLTFFCLLFLLSETHKHSVWTAGYKAWHQSMTWIQYLKKKQLTKNIPTLSHKIDNKWKSLCLVWIPLVSFCSRSLSVFTAAPRFLKIKVICRPL